jgi:hypothetical protein
LVKRGIGEVSNHRESRPIERLSGPLHTGQGQQLSAKNAGIPGSLPPVGIVEALPVVGQGRSCSRPRPGGGDLGDPPAAHQWISFGATLAAKRRGYHAVSGTLPKFRLFAMNAVDFLGFGGIGGAGRFRRFC